MTQTAKGSRPPQTQTKLYIVTTATALRLLRKKLRVGSAENIPADLAVLNRYIRSILLWRRSRIIGIGSKSDADLLGELLTQGA
jgi:hypothetical protein